MKDAKSITMKNRGPATQGVCPVAVKNAPWLDAFFVKMDDFLAMVNR